MKDKLVKHNHSKFYYYFRKVGACFSVFVAASALIAIPISIAATIKSHQAKEEEKVEEEEKDIESEISLLKF